MRRRLSKDLIGGLTSFVIEALLIIALGVLAALAAWIAITLVG